jgi:protein phosphatase
MTGDKPGKGLCTCSSSDRGVREANEDACGIFVIPHSIGPFTLLAVADGLGGHPAGEVTSRVAVDALSSYIRIAIPGPDPVFPALESIMEGGFQAANRAVVAEADSGNGCRGMSTTLVAALLDESGAGVVGNIGDSRAYLLGSTICRITRDHSSVQELVDRGILTVEEARHHPLRHIVTRVVGREPPDHPDIFPIRLDNHSILLNSDGLTDGLEEQEILSLAGGIRVTAACSMLVERAKKKSRDNITVVMARRL